MSLFEQWEKQAYVERTQEEYNKFWGEYLPKEQKIYEYLLENKLETLEGSLGELSKRFDMDDVAFIGFLDGINTSIAKQLDMNSLTSESNITLNIDFEKLYYNMHEAKADWLYNLPQWNDVLSEERRAEIKKEYKTSRTVVNENKIGRNEPCPCGSGKKYKKCCLNK